MPHQSGPSFLDFPYEIRSYIYRLAGVVRTCPIYFNSKPPEANEYDDDGDKLNPQRFYCRKLPNPYCDCQRGGYQPIPFLLFLSSKVIYEEVSSLFYSQNWFWLSYSGPGSFSALQNLRPSTISQIRSLYIVLHSMRKNQSPCQCWPKPSIRERPLRLKAPREYHQNFIKEWRVACERLASCVSESCLEMCLICDTDSKNVAADVFDPIKQLPTLASFSVRLSHPMQWDVLRFNRQRHLILRDMAKDVSMQLTRRNSQPVFRYDLLPAELQQQILGYTGLVAPSHLGWIPGRGFSSTDELYDKHRPDCRVCDGVRLSCCIPLLPRSGGTWAVQCSSCWAFPSALFLVSRDFHECATRIFWSCNKFVVVVAPDIVDGIRPIPEQRPFTAFFPPHAIQHLRFLQFNRPLHWTPALWEHTIHSLHEMANLSRLTISIDMWGCWDPTKSEDRISEISETDKDQEYWKAYNQLIKPLLPLRGQLKNFFMHVSWHGGWGDDMVERRDWWERNLERMVMGEDYDSSLNGRKEVVWERPPAWGMLKARHGLT